MTQNSLNILDLLQVSPQKAGAEQLGLLGSLGQTDALNPETQEVSFDMIFGNMLAEMSPDLIGNQQTFTPIETEVLQGQTTVLPEKVSAENILAFNEELQNLNSQNLSLQNLNVKEILAQQNKELENGQFKVISKDVEDSKLSLVIENSQGKQISVSLPLDSIKNRNIVEQRVSLEDTYYKNELKTLIEKVDVKTIEVKSAETKLNHAPFKPVEISILGEQNSAVITLKASLKKNQIKITENVSQSNSKAAVLDESNVWGDKVNVVPKNPSRLIEKVAPVSKEEITNELLGNKQENFNGTQNGTQKSNSPLNLQSSSSKQSLERVDSYFYNYNTDKVDATVTKENMQSIRMQLPENIKSVLQPNSQAVVIKMNPENLGPAKLSLSISGGKLRAKLVVTSENAKHILDSSMGRLVDQLHKADVLVDKIDVTLDENKNQNEQFNQKQQWQRKMSHKNIDLNQFEQNELEQLVPQPMESTLQSISQNAVNFLA